MKDINEYILSQAIISIAVEYKKVNKRGSPQILPEQGPLSSNCIMKKRFTHTEGLVLPKISTFNMHLRTVW